MAENKTCSSASNCNRASCEGCPSQGGAQKSLLEECNPFSSVKKVIGVVSGKGGVGKSFVTASLMGNSPMSLPSAGPCTPYIFGIDGPVISASRMPTSYPLRRIALNIPVLGLVENYSFLKCPDCGKEIRLFGDSKVDAAALQMGIPVLGKMPLDPKYAGLADQGKFHEIENPYLKEAEDKVENL